MASYPLGQAGLTKFFFLQAGQSLSIYPAGLITIISVIAGASRDPACFPLAVHPPVIGTDFAGAVINRTPELMPIGLAVRQGILSVGPVRPEFPNDKSIPAPLDQISIILICLKIACAPQSLEHHRMAAADTASLFVVVGMPGNGHLLPAEGAVTGFGSAALVMVKYKIFPHGHLVGPPFPIFWQFRHLRKILVPRVSDPLVAPFQLFVPHIPLKVENAEIATALAGKIVLNQGRIFLADPAGSVVVPARPFQTVQFCIPPLFFQVIVGQKLAVFLVDKYLISRIITIQPQMIRQKKGGFQNAILHQTVHKREIGAGSIGVAIISRLLFWLIRHRHFFHLLRCRQRRHRLKHGFLQINSPSFSQDPPHTRHWAEVSFHQW